MSLTDEIEIGPSYARKPIVRRATAADLEAYYGHEPNRPTITAMVGEVDGKIVAVGGFAHQRGVLIAFCDLKPEARRYRVSLVKAARKMVEEMGARGKVIYADADASEPGAVRWIKSLGFEPVEEMKGRYKWLG